MTDDDVNLAVDICFYTQIYLSQLTVPCYVWACVDNVAGVSYSQALADGMIKSTQSISKLC